MSDSIFKLGDKFGVQSPFGDWREKVNSAEINPPKILDIEVKASAGIIKLNHNEDFNTNQKSVVIIVKTTRDVGTVKVIYNNQIEMVRGNGTEQTFYVYLDIPIQGYYEDCLFTISIFDTKQDTKPADTKTIIRQIALEFPIYPPILNNTCFCKQKNWSAEDLRYIVIRLRQFDGSKTKRVKGDNGNWLYLDKNGKIIPSTPRGREPKNSVGAYKVPYTLYTSIKDKLFIFKDTERLQHITYKQFAQELNQIFHKYKINTCIRKIHFFAQIYHESNKFRSTYEGGNPTNIVGGGFYKGRGLKQITHDYNYLEYYDYVHHTQFFKKYIKYRKSINETLKTFNTRTKYQYMSKKEMSIFNQFVPKLATELYHACNAAGWYWQKNNINQYADKDDIFKVSAAVNSPRAKSSTGIVGYENREIYYNNLKTIFNYENCKK